MRITEHEISVFFWGAAIGTAIGSVITYLNTTREKRLISRVRHDIDLLGGFHDLTSAQYRKTNYPNAELASDKRILEVHGWAQRWKKSRKPGKSENKITATWLAAEVIICEELLGLSATDAIGAGLRLKNLDDLKTLSNVPKAAAEAYEENYQREWKVFKKRVYDGLSAVARGEKVRLDPETLEAAKGIMDHQGLNNPRISQQNPEVTAWNAVFDDLRADPLTDAKAIHRRMDQLLFPDALEDFEDDAEIMKRLNNYIERTNRGENVRLDPEITDGIRKIRERKAREAKWESDVG